MPDLSTANPEATRIDPQSVYTPKEAAARLKVSVRTLRRWRAQDLGPKATSEGNVVRYLGVELLSWLERRWRP